MVSTPVEETLATALPEMEPRSALPMTAALAGPPTVLRVSAKARRMKKSPAPDFSRKAPMRMNGATYWIIILAESP